MPQINIYLPEELHRQVKDSGMPVGEICKWALRRELRAIRRRHVSEQLDTPVSGNTTRRQ
jgi:post-segregation antitoxin (ccd killing protein)